MRCPKCQYVGFEGQDRCRHCGYDLSLSSTLPAMDVPLIAADAGAADDDGADLPLRSEPTARERARAAIRQRAAAVRTPQPESFDLPLFSGGPESRSLASPSIPTPSPTPRPPLAVRRATVEAPRARPGMSPIPTPSPEPPHGPTFRPSPDGPPSEGPPPEGPPSRGPSGSPLGGRLGYDLTLAAAEPPMISDTALRLEPVVEASPSTTLAADRMAPPPTDAAGRAPRRDLDPAASVAVDGAAARLAPLGTRVWGGLVDLAILAVVDAAVLAFTLQLTGVTWAQIDRLPAAPMTAFLALLATGYLSMFTLLTGQTAGQMAMGSRVVETGGRPVRFGHAVLRAVVQVLTVPLLGLGFIPALLGDDRRALYDRLSDTEVVRVDD